jgi:hypothetical protein
LTPTANDASTFAKTVMLMIALLEGKLTCIKQLLHPQLEKPRSTSTVLLVDGGDGTYRLDVTEHIPGRELVPNLGLPTTDVPLKTWRATSHAAQASKETRHVPAHQLAGSLGTRHFLSRTANAFLSYRVSTKMPN